MVGFFVKWAIVIDLALVAALVWRALDSGLPWDALLNDPREIYKLLASIW